jgi:valacyclovir hydrolase
MSSAWPSSSTSQLVQLDGGQTMHCESVGSGDHVVVALPGALGSGRTDFPSLADHFAKSTSIRLLLIDPPGYGLSRPPDRTWPVDFLDRDANVVAETLAQLGERRFSLLGWSDGGITAIILAANYPDRVSVEIETVLVFTKG